MLSLEFLETNHVWFGFLEPRQEVLQPLIDVVDVEGSDFHCAAPLSINGIRKREAMIASALARDVCPNGILVEAVNLQLVLEDLMKSGFDGEQAEFNQRLIYT